MSILIRLGNLFKGFLSLFVSDLEKANPEIAYENAINSMTEKYIKARSATAAVIRRRDEISERLQSDKTQLAQVQNDLQAALATSQDDLAVVLIEKKNLLAREIEEMINELGIAEKDANQAKEMLTTVQVEINKLKAEKDRMLAKMNSAEARLRIQGQLDGLSVDAEVQALDKVRDHIKNTVAEAGLASELGNNDLDTRLKNLSRQAGSISAKQELEQMKAQRAGATQPNKQI